jgi:hypothetical protein
MLSKLIKMLLLISAFTGYFSASAQNNTLEYYQDQALKNSPLLKDYQELKRATNHKLV